MNLRGIFRMAWRIKTLRIRPESDPIAIKPVESMQPCLAGTAALPVPARSATALRRGFSNPKSNNDA